MVNSCVTTAQPRVVCFLFYFLCTNARAEALPLFLPSKNLMGTRS